MALLDQLINQILEYHDLFVLQESNRTAIALLHKERHVSEHDLLEEWSIRLSPIRRSLYETACAWRAASKPSWACWILWVTSSPRFLRRRWPLCSEKRPMTS